MDWFLYDRDLRHERVKKQMGIDAIQSYHWSFTILSYRLNFPAVDNFLKAILYMVKYLFRVNNNAKKN